MQSLRKKAQKKVTKEFQIFKRKMIYRLTGKAVWDMCHKIHFYCCIYEYFELKPKIPNVYLELVLAEPAFLEFVWSDYLRSEDTRFDTWEDIERLLDIVLMNWKQPAAS